MIMKSLLATCATVLLAAPALAQSTSGKSTKPLDLQLPPDSLPAAASSAPQPAHASSSQGSRASQPGVYYGDTSGRIAESRPGPPPCDDSTYDKAHVHGSVGMGVVAGNHVSGNYQSGMVNITKAFGSCEHPSGSMSISIGVSQGHFGDHGW